MPRMLEQVQSGAPAAGVGDQGLAKRLPSV